MSIAINHVKDVDCAVDPETDLCRECGVWHGDPCYRCGGRGFHRPECCPWTDAEECAMARERSVAGTNEPFASCLAHDIR